MAFVIKKRNKYMTGHGYATGFGYNFHWSFDIGKARRFLEDDGIIVSFKQLTDGKIVEVPSTKRELKQLGKKLMKEGV